MIQKSKRAFRTISEAAEELNVPQHVLRFWETKFSQIKPMKRGGNRRYYRRSDIELLKAIQHQLYDESKTIKDVQQMIRDQGLKAFVDAWIGDQPAAPVEEASEEVVQEAVSAPEPEAPEASEEVDDMLFEAPVEGGPARTDPKGEPEPEDDTIRVSKDLVRALVADLKALRALIDRM